jgi:hypothetical protein
MTFADHLRVPVRLVEARFVLDRFLATVCLVAMARTSAQIRLIPVVRRHAFAHAGKPVRA